MALTTIAGSVTGLRIDTTIATDSNTATSTTQSVKMNFRVGNRAAYMKVATNLTNGDVVTAAGTDRSGELDVIALKNHTTNLLYWVRGMPLWVIILTLLFGVLTLGFLIGFFILPIGVVMGFQFAAHQKKLNEAFALLKAAPVPAGMA